LKFVSSPGIKFIISLIAAWRQGCLGTIFEGGRGGDESAEIPFWGFEPKGKVIHIVAGGANFTEIRDSCKGKHGNCELHILWGGVSHG
jgi:hypothetical protein